MSLTALPPLPHIYHRSRPEQETQEAEFLGVRNPVGSAAYVQPSVGFTSMEGRGDSHPMSREGLTPPPEAPARPHRAQAQTQAVATASTWPQWSPSVAWRLRGDTARGHGDCPVTPQGPRTHIRTGRPVCHISVHTDQYWCYLLGCGRGTQGLLTNEESRGDCL